MKIGILSDTHDLLRSEALSALHGSEAILHAGDVCRQEILDELEKIARVYVVRGNNDKEWAEHIPFFLDFEIAGLRVYITHKKTDLPDDLSPYDLVVFGHSHKYEESHRGKTLLLNPGSCGPRRFNQPITLAILDIIGGKIAVSRIDIPHKGKPLAVPMEEDIKAQISTVVKEIQKGHSPEKIATRHGWNVDLVEQIARLYVTHPGVTVDGILEKMGVK
jgi:phosphoesterase, MJ0936 family